MQQEPFPFLLREEDLAFHVRIKQTVMFFQRQRGEEGLEGSPEGVFVGRDPLDPDGER